MTRNTQREKPQRPAFQCLLRFSFGICFISDLFIHERPDLVVLSAQRLDLLFLRCLRMAFFFLIRRISLFDTNHRFRRTAPNTPLRMTFLRKRFSNCCWDSFGRNSTLTNGKPPFSKTI
jgi:hypothetical protein